MGPGAVHESNEFATKHVLMEKTSLNRMAATVRKSIAGLRVVRFDVAPNGLVHGTATDQVVGRVVAAVELRGHGLFTVLRDEEKPGSCLRHDPLALGLHHRDLVLHSDHADGGEWHTSSRRPMHYAAGTPLVALHTEQSTAYCVGQAHLRLVPAPSTGHLYAAFLATCVPPSVREVRAVLAAHPDAEVGAALALIPGARQEGSVWRSEALFLRRISPFAKVRNLSREALRSIVWEYKRFAPDGGSEGKIVRLDLRDRLWVHGRAGQPCRVCGNLIEARRQGFGAGFIYFCTRCQGVK